MSGLVNVLTSLRSGFSAAVGTQVVLTLASLGYATVGGSPTTLVQKKEVFDAPHYDLVTELVTKMYSGRGVSHPYVPLADSVTFEDPAARCCGPEEVREAFRALSCLTPKAVQPPRCIDVKPQGESIALSYALHQHYLGGRMELQSVLVVTVQLRQLKHIPESEFLVLQMEELWNGIPLWNSYLFRIVRRINGWVSWHLTRKLL